MSLGSLSSALYRLTSFLVSSEAWACGVSAGAAGLESTPSAIGPAEALRVSCPLELQRRLTSLSSVLGSRLEGRWSAASMTEPLATLPPQNTPGESGGNCKMPPGGSAGSVLARNGSPGLVVVAGTIWRLGMASMLSGLTLASSHKINNIRAANRWPWV